MILLMSTWSARAPAANSSTANSNPAAPFLKLEIELMRPSPRLAALKRKHNRGSVVA